MNDSETDGEDETAPGDGCACCGGVRDENGGAERIGSERVAANGTGERFLGESRSGSPFLEAELPADLRTALGRFLGIGPVDTLGEWAAACRRRVGGGSIGLDDLCHSGSATNHRAELEGETYHFRCFYDAVVLAALADAPVDVRTESPDGTEIEARAVGTEELTATPADAVFSFGVAADAPADGDPTLEDVYEAVCPYVKAFPTRDAYEEWARDVPAATVATSLAGATDLAAALVE